MTACFNLEYFFCSTHLIIQKSHWNIMACFASDSYVGNVNDNNSNTDSDSGNDSKNDS